MGPGLQGRHSLREARQIELGNRIAAPLFAAVAVADAGCPFTIPLKVLPSK
jgi:hypothetical protein